MNKNTLYIIICFVLLLLPNISISQNWSGIGGGVNDWVYASTIWNGKVVVGGKFSGAGGVTANHIAVWNDTAWSTLGAGMDGDVWALTVFNGELIAGGFFFNADGIEVKYIARWDGTGWIDMEGGMDAPVVALTVCNGKLYAGGYFTTANIPANYIAQWDGHVWSTLGSGMGGGQGQVMALTAYGTDLIAAGFFTTAGGVSTPHIAKWDGTSWSSIGAGIPWIVYSLIPYKGNLIAGGLFSSAGGVPANKIAQWDGSAWSALGSGMTGGTYGYVWALTVIGNYLVAGGNFTNAGGNAAENLAAWDGTAWYPWATSMSSGGTVQWVYTLSTWGSSVIAGGIFNGIDGAGTANVGKRDTSTSLPPPAPTLVFPSDNTNCVIPGSLFSWNLLPSASAYEIEIAYDAAFSQLMLDHPGVSGYLYIPDGLLYDTLYYWRLRASNGSGSSDWSATASFRTSSSLSTPPLQTTPLDNTTNIEGITYFSWLPLCTASSYQLQISTDSGFTSNLLDQSGIADTFYSASGFVANAKYYWRIRSYHDLTASNWSQVWTFTTSSSMIASIHFNSSWNIVSVPLTAPDMRKTVLYPPSISNSFAYQGSYVTKETLQCGSGYWLKFLNDTTLNISGTSMMADTVDLIAGWNMIGSISHNVPVTGITSLPGAIVTSEFYEYNNGYRIASVIEPGKGYWVKASQTGMIILSSSLAKSTVGKIHSIASSELPPPPPGEVNTNNSIIPSEFALLQNYPNPFNPSTVISYSLPFHGMVTLKVYNTLGQEVSTLVNELQDAGFKSVTWDAGKMPSGIYTYRLTTDEFSMAKKMLLLR